MSSNLIDSDSARVIAGLPCRYEIRRIIGRGGMGIVLQTFDLQLEREVAVKVLLFDGCRDHELQERFLREIKVLVSLDHPNIVKILSWEVNSNGNPYFVMELLDGQPLSAEIGGGKRLSLLRFREVFSQLLSGLREIHARNIVHRDLKPSNIVLCHSASGLCPKIVDFGIARTAGPSGESGLTGTNLLGSPAYMSPEQCKGESINHLSDIYSLACIMHEALVGEAPFQGETPMEVMYKHLTAEVPRLSELSDSRDNKRLAEVIERCLSKDPSARFQSADELLREMNEIFSCRPETGKMFACGKQSSPRTKMLSATALAAVSLTLFGIFIWQSTQKHDSKITADNILKDDVEGRKSQVESFKNAVSHLESMYVHAGNSRDKLEIAERLLAKLNLLVKAQMATGDYSGAESSLKRSIPLCQVVNPRTDMLKVGVFINLASCFIEERKYAEAESQLKEAHALLNHLEKNNYHQIYAFVYLNLEIRRHQFDRDGHLFALMTQGRQSGKRVRRKHEKALTFYSRYTRVPTDEAVVERADQLACLIMKESPASPEEKLAALDLMNRIAEFELDQGSSLAGRAVEAAGRLLKGIPPQTSGLAPVANRTGALSVEYTGNQKIE